MRKFCFAGIAAAACVLLLALAAYAEEGFRQERVRFAEGVATSVIKGRLKGRAFVDYQLCGKAGQSLSVRLKRTNPQNYFNILPPHSETALFVGQTGEDFSGVLPEDGDYTIRVYLMRAAARRNESSRYTLTVVAPGAFDSELKLLGISFHVSSPNADSGNTVSIKPSGLLIDNAPVLRQIDGLVTGAEVADLNVDGSPEVYVYVRSRDPGARASLVAYSANRRKSLSEINLPRIADHKGADAGYRGHDEMAVVESTFVRRFPLFGGSDGAPAPTGLMRQLQYKLVPGEASWQLRLDKMIEF